MLRVLPAVLALFALLATCSPAALAQPPGTERAAIRLLLDTDRLTPGQQAIAAIVVDIADGWHAQSSRPLSEDFIPFKASMTSTGNLRVLDPLYAPGDLHDFPLLGGRLSVYSDRVITFVPFIVPDDAPPGEIELTATVHLQVCNDEMCDRPTDIVASARTRIVAGEKNTSTHGEIFSRFDPNVWLHEHPLPADATTQNAAESSTPARASWIHYSDAALAEARKTGKPVVVKFTAAWCAVCHAVERRVFGDTDTLAELNRRGATLIKVDLTRSDAPEWAMLNELNPASRTIPFTAVYLQGQDRPATLDGMYSSADLLGVIDSGKSIGQTAFGIDVGNLPLPLKLLLAFGVGILLNVVPCVLPVLPIKAIGFYEAARHSRGRSLFFGACFSFGMIATFGLLALLAISSKTGWGSWIGNPWFAGTLVFVLAAAALQSFGALEFALPASVSSMEASHTTVWGNVAWGIITTLLSTPCTIGAFAAVVGAAIATGPTLGALILIVVGCGMASPYLLLSAFPEWARRFPRTGPWPSVVKQMTGFLILATAAFFAGPLLPPSWGGSVIWGIIAFCLAACGVFLVVRTLQIAPRPRPIAIASVIALLLIAGGVMVMPAIA